MKKTYSPFGNYPREDQTTANNTDVIIIDIRVNGGRLGELGLGAVVTDQAGSKPKVLSRIAQRTEALARPKTFGDDKYISLSSKIRLICTLFVSVMLYYCETWTLTADIKKKGSQ